MTYKYDRSLNQLEITPAVRSGGVETNLNLRIGAQVYILVVKVVTDVRSPMVLHAASPSKATPARTMRPASPAPRFSGPRMSIWSWRPKPWSGPKAIRSSGVPIRISGSRAAPQNYTWNDCLVSLEDMAQFIDLDLIVFRVRWVNRTRDALFLDPGQYALSVAGRRIPIVARYKVGVGAVVYPGQLETVYLAVQGRLSRETTTGNSACLRMARRSSAISPP